ncbi:unnamed protein product [Mortierella alpina]
MDKDQEVDPSATDTAKAASLAPRRASILSGEWIPLPTLSVPEDNETLQSTKVQQHQQRRQFSSTNAIDDNERRRSIDRLRTALTRDTAMTLVRSASEADSIRDRDIVLFHEVYSVCFEDAQPLMSLIKEEMLIQMLEDLGEHLLGTHALDSSDAGALRESIGSLLQRTPLEGTPQHGRKK